MRTRIKICGITNLEDAQAAVEYGADALGFIFVPNTPRYVGKIGKFIFAGKGSIPGQISPFVTCVAVRTDSIGIDVFQNSDIKAVQFYEHTWEDKKTFRRAAGNLHLIQAFRVKDESSLDEIANCLETFSPHAIVLDTYHKDKLGGSGETFNWELAVEAKQRFGLPIILAGGLTAENVGEAVRTVRPYAVDVSSGVEAAPGRKNHAKMKAFVQAVRKADE